MPKTEHYQWYVEQFADTELHHHAIDELYYSGRTPFQSVAVLRTAAFGKMLVLDGDTQSSQADEKIYHESLVHPALAAVRGAARGADPRRRRGRDACARCCAIPGSCAARWSTSTARSSSWPRNTCPNGRPARSTIRARTSSSAMRWRSSSSPGRSMRSSPTSPSRCPTRRRFRSSTARSFATSRRVSRRAACTCCKPAPPASTTWRCTRRWRARCAPTSRTSRASTRTCRRSTTTGRSSPAATRTTSRRSRPSASTRTSAQLRGENYFYDAETHRRLFSLPLYLRRELAKARRRLR